MARISSYPYDTTVTDNDAWIGTEATNRQTKQFTAEAVAEYLNINAKGTANNTPLEPVDKASINRKDKIAI